jgi:hypothetical protein
MRFSWASGLEARRPFEWNGEDPIGCSVVRAGRCHAPLLLWCKPSLAHGASRTHNQRSAPMTVEPLAPGESPGRACEIRVPDTNGFSPR